MSSLRETLLEIQKEKTLKKLLGNNYAQATDADKAHYLSVLGNSIENDVD
jgi:ABC-type transporter MlaC component